MESIRHHRAVGSVAPSSKSLSSLLANPLLERAPRSANVLEVGAGTGSVTRVLLPRIPRGSRLDIVEANAQFAAHLRELVRGYQNLGEQQERVRVHNIGVEQLATDRRYDVIVSGLPFSNFSPGRWTTSWAATSICSVPGAHSPTSPIAAVAGSAPC